MTIVTSALSGVLLCLLLLPVGFIYQNKKIDFLDPIFFVLTSVALGVLVRGVYLTYISKNDLPAYIMGLDISSILSGYLFVFISLFSFSIGYATKQNKLLAFHSFFEGACWSGKRVFLICVSLVLVSIVFWALFLRSIDIGSLAISALSRKRAVLDDEGKKIATGYLRWGASLVTLAYYVFLISVCKKPRVGVLNFLILLLMFISSIAFPVFTSARIEVISAFINTIVIVHFLKARTNRTFELKVLGMLFLAFIVLAIVASVLSTFRQGGIEREGVESATSAERIIDSLVGNQNFYGIGKSTVAYEEGDERIYGRSLASILTAPIPRTLWAEKPEVGMSYYFGSKYYGIDYTGNRGGGMPPGISIELFLNFGLVGLVVGMWFYGFFLRGYYKFISKYLYERNENAVLVHVCILMPATFYMTGNDIAQATIAMATFLIPAVFVIFFIRVRQAE